VLRFWNSQLTHGPDNASSPSAIADPLASRGTVPSDPSAGAFNELLGGSFAGSPLRGSAAGEQREARAEAVNGPAHLERPRTQPAHALSHSVARPGNLPLARNSTKPSEPNLNNNFAASLPPGSNGSRTDSAGSDARRPGPSRDDVLPVHFLMYKI
jgi:hypothetical protein